MNKKYSKNFILASICISPFLVGLLCLGFVSAVAGIFGEGSLNDEPFSFFAMILLVIYAFLPNVGIFLLIGAFVLTCLAWKNQESNFEKFGLIFYFALLLMVTIFDGWWFITKQELKLP